VDWISSEFLVSGISIPDPGREAMRNSISEFFLLHEGLGDVPKEDSGFFFFFFPKHTSFLFPPPAPCTFPDFSSTDPSSMSGCIPAPHACGFPFLRRGCWQGKGVRSLSQAEWLLPFLVSLMSFPAFKIAQNPFPFTSVSPINSPMRALTETTTLYSLTRCPTLILRKTLTSTPSGIFPISCQR